jgi:hypothetical protein
VTLGRILSATDAFGDYVWLVERHRPMDDAVAKGNLPALLRRSINFGYTANVPAFAINSTCSTQVANAKAF